jgi:hypothetical protein
MCNYSAMAGRSMLKMLLKRLRILSNFLDRNEQLFILIFIAVTAFSMWVYTKPLREDLFMRLECNSGDNTIHIKEKESNCQR